MTDFITCSIDYSNPWIDNVNSGTWLGKKVGKSLDRFSLVQSNLF